MIKLYDPREPLNWVVCPLKKQIIRIHLVQRSYATGFEGVVILSLDTLENTPLEFSENSMNEILCLSVQAIGRVLFLRD